MITSPWDRVLDEFERDVAALEAALARGAYDDIADARLAAPDDLAGLSELPVALRSRAEVLHSRLNQTIERAEHALRSVADAMVSTRAQSGRGSVQPPLYFDFTA